MSVALGLPETNMAFIVIGPHNAGQLVAIPFRKIVTEDPPATENTREVD
jgi:hypothetical protein